MLARRFNSKQKRSLVAACLLTITAALAVATGLTQSAGAAGERSASSGVLVLDHVFNNKNLDPHRENSTTANIALHAVYDTLLTFKGADYTPVPSVATSWKVSDDDRSITFTLRKDIVFSDGTPLTAKDVVFSFARLYNVKGTQSFLLRGLKLRAIGKYQVVLEADTPNPALLRIVENPALAIVNRKVVAANGGTAALNAATTDKAELWLSQNSAGSGPYVIKDFVPQQQITLEVNPKYWGPAPRFKLVIIRNMPTPAQLLNVQRGTREIAIDVPAIEVPNLKSNPSVQVVSSNGTNIFYLTVQQKPGVTIAANPKIMQALRLGIDYEGLMALSPGTARLPGMVPIGFLGSLPADQAIKRDVAKAKQLVIDSGIKNPTFDLSTVAGFSYSGILLETIAQKLQASFAEIGITANLRLRPIGTHLQFRSELKLEVNIGLQSMSYPDPNNYLDYAPDGPQAGYVAWVDPVALAIATQARTTIDDKKRAALFVKYQQRINTVGPFMPIMQPPVVLVGSPRLTGLVRNGIWVIDVARVGEKKA